MSRAQESPTPRARISVVIPAHRIDRWLDEAVESALDSRDVDLEVVVVLNGMTELVARPWMTDDRVRVIHDPEPLGPTRAMIRGLDASSAEFVARLDGDDRMLPNRLSAQIAWLRDHPETPLVGTAVRRIDGEGHALGEVRMPTGDDVRRHLVLSNTVSHSSILVRRDALTAAGGYDDRLEQMEDYDVILRLARRGPVAVLPELLTDYRIHAGQISRGAAPRGPHIDAVIRGRRQLGAHLGMPALSIAARNIAWLAAQHLRHRGLIRPGHEY